MGDAWGNIFHNNNAITGERFMSKPPGAEYPMMYPGKPPLAWGEYEDGVEPGTPEAHAADVNKNFHRGSPVEVSYIKKIKKQPEGSQITDPAWIGASKRLYHYMNPKSAPQPSVETPSGVIDIYPGGNPRALQSGPAPAPGAGFTDEDYANWGVNFMSKFNYNITAMLIDVNKLSGAPSEVAASMYYMMETADRDGMLLENFTRGFSNFMTDPTTYVGLSTIGIGMVGAQSGKQLSSMAFKEVLKNIVTARGGSAGMVVGAESMAYSMIDNTARQGVKINAGQQDELNPGESLLSLAAGFILGNRLSAALPGGIEAVKRGAGVVKDVASNLDVSGTVYSNPVFALFDAAKKAYEATPNDPKLKAEFLSARRDRDAAQSSDEVDTSYRMQHEAGGPDGAARLDDMTKGGEVYPDDFYGPDGLKYYGNANSPVDQESYKIISEVAGDPDATVTIYRAVPDDDGISTINPGDFVSLSRSYAEDHGSTGYGSDGQSPGKVIEMDVRVSDIYNDGNSINEFGYFPDVQTSSVTNDNDALTGTIATPGKAIPQVAVRSEGGLPIAQEKGDNNLRLHLMRLEKMNDSGAVYPGGPKNPRTVIQAPKGTDLPDIVVGNITPDDWQTRIEKSMSTEEIQKAANWYKVVFGEFQKQADGDPKEIARLTDAWFSGQQNSSPGQTLNDVLFVFEQIKRGVPKEKLRGKGLPSANRIVIDILTSSKIEGGAGQKIADFLDSGYEKNVRAIMGNKPEGGSPFVVDIHTARDTGLVDETYKNHLTRLGYDVPDGLIADVGGGGINGPQYENRALFGQQLTQHLNNQKWMGRSDWEAAEVQAIGWMQLSSMYGASNTGGDVVDAFTRNTRRISMEIDPGAGSPLAEKYGADFGALDLDAQRSINNEVTAKAIELVNKQTGITLGSNVHGTGGWELYQNPSTVQQAIASKDTAIEAAARLGYLMQQTEVWVNSPKTMTKNPKHFSIDIVETTGESLREGKALTNLFDAIISEEPNELFRGYQPIEIDGKPGIRILITDDAVKASPLTKAKAMAYIQEFANGKLGEITDRLNFDAEIDIMEADLTRLRNNWEEDKQGGGYKSYFSGQPRKDASAENSIDGVLNTDGAELERLFSQRIREAQGQRGGTSQVDSSASSNNGGGE